jgi:hypothetical protein
MTDADGSIDWSLTTWEGNRRRQRDEFRRLSFREKIERIEQMEDVAALFNRRSTTGGRVSAPADAEDAE